MQRILVSHHTVYNRSHNNTFRQLFKRKFSLVSGENIDRLVFITIFHIGRTNGHVLITKSFHLNCNHVLPRNVKKNVCVSANGIHDIYTILALSRDFARVIGIM